MKFKMRTGTEGYEKCDFKNWNQNLNPTNYSRPQNSFQLKSSMPFSILLKKLKHCISLKFSIEDQTELMFRKNLLKNHLRFLVNIQA
jgi:hypothetical protein